MQYKLVTELLRDHFQQSTIVPIDALVPDANRYTVLALQPSGAVIASKENIGNANPEVAFEKHRNFLATARQRNVHVAIAPEYSCPWSVIRDALKNGTRPLEGRIWIIGCESIATEELQQLIEEYSEIIWICDFPGATGTQAFVDPVCFLFHIRDNEGQVKLAIAVQFKTQPMSDTKNRLEEHYMIPGITRYIFENDADSNRLLTIICSDALDFRIEDLQNRRTRSYLILHPQLCADPLHNTFRAYRDAFRTSGTNHELITVNWAKGFQINNFPSSEFGGTYYFIKSCQVDTDDERLAHNHNNGAYWGYWKTHRTHVTQFNFSEGVYYFDLSKPSQGAAVDMLVQRQGLRMIENLQWCDQTCQWVANNGRVDDGFNEFCDSIGQEVEPLKSPDLCSMTKERLLAISTVDFEEPPKQDWCDPRKLRSCQLTADEKCQRTTVIQEPSGGGYQEVFDRKHEALDNFCFLRNGILNDPLPKCIKDLEGNFGFRLAKSSNITNGEGEKPALVAFIGNKPSKRHTQAFDNLLNLLTSESVDDSRKRRVVVWARVGGTVQTKIVNDKNIDADLSESGRSILKDE